MSLVSIQYIHSDLQAEYIGSLNTSPRAAVDRRLGGIFGGSRGGHDVVIVLRRSSRAAPSSRGYIEANEGRAGRDGGVDDKAVCGIWTC
jgi:hypothetical protein